MKDSFVLYTKYEKRIQRLTMEQRGVLFTSILLYEAGSELPEMDDAVAMAFDFIREDLDENRAKYEEICRKRKEAGSRKPSQEQANDSKSKQMLPNAPAESKSLQNGYDNDNEYDYEYENDINISPSKPKKHKHGQYKHVLLTDIEHEKLINEFGDGKTASAIQFLDEYIEEKSYKSKSHYMAMRRWVFDAISKRPSTAGLPYSGIDF